MRILFLITLVFCINTSRATNYYFSTSIGDDSRSNTAAQNAATPWKTLQKLNDVFTIFQPGDSLLFKRGDVFEGAINAVKSGSASLPIVFSAFGSGVKPVISGLKTITQWTQVGNGIWEADYPADGMVNMLLINDVIKEIGRYPNANASNKGYLSLESSSGNAQITDNQLPASPNWTGANVVIRKNRWVLDKNLVTNHTGNTLQYNSESGNPPSANFGYFLQNHPQTLDIAGEWYYKTGAQKLGIYSPSVNPSSLKIQAGSVKTLVAIRNLSNLLFDNLVFKGANNNAFDISNSQRITIRNCEVLYSGINAVNGSSLTELTVENCLVQYSNNSAFDLRYTFNAIIRNNRIKCTGIFAGMGKGDSGSYEAIMIDGDTELIELNEIDSTGYIPITFRGNTNIIRNNVISNFTLVKDDGGGIYSWNNIAGAPATYGSKISGNIVLNGVGAGEGTDDVSYHAANGIYMDDNTAGVQITGNTVANCGLYGIYIHNGHELAIENNTIYNNKSQLILAHDNYAAYSPIRNVRLVNNILFSKESNQMVSELYTPDNDIASFGTFDSNYYCRPTYDNFTIHTSYVANGAYVNKSFDVDNWKTVFGKDANSKRSPIGLPSPDLIRFEYNASAVSKTISLSETYLDATGKVYTGSVTLQPFSSVVLLRQSSIPSICSNTGLIGLELWENVLGSSIADIPVQTTASTKSQLNGSFEIFNAGDAYGTRIRGQLCPPQTGNYTFWIAGDDVAELWLSTQDNPAGKTRIANVSAWTNFREWNKSSSQKSIPIYLNAGQRYYIEALQKEGNGGDHVSIAWQLPDGTFEGPMPASRLSLYAQLANQSINFNALSNVAFGAAPFAINATSTSGLPVSFRIVSGPATLNGNTLTLTGTGTITIEASQAGNSVYNAATPLTQSFISYTASTGTCSATGTILREQFNGIGGNTIASFPLQGTPSTSSQLNAFEGPVNTADNYASRIRGYLCPPESGNYTFWISGDDAAELYLSPGDNPANKVRIAYFLTWTNPREWTKYPSQKSATVFLQSGQRYYIEAIHKEGDGGDNLSVAWQLPNGVFEAPIPGSRLSPFTTILTQSAQSINFAAVSTQAYGAGTLTLNATATSSLPVSFRVVSGPANINGSVITFTAVGSVVVEASQGGNNLFLPANPVTQTIAVSKGSQSISFAAIPSQSLSAGTLTLSATASSGLAVSFRVASGPATITSNVLTFTAAGIVAIEASQPGNNDYNAALPVAQSFSITVAEAPVACTAAGTITHELWNNVPGATLTDLSFLNLPSISSVITSFEANSNIGDNYGSRIRGYICPPISGSYTFWIAGDDAAELWLSTDEDPAKKVKIAWFTSWTNPREWNRFSTQKSATITLQAGRKYYIEALHKEAVGGDNLAVAWQLPNSVFEAPVSGSRLSPFVVSTISDCANTGSVLREQWNNVNGINISDANFQGIPSASGNLSIFESTANAGDNYSSRIRGYVCPPQTGYYTFWIAGDDAAELWLSTDDNAVNKIKIAYLQNWTNQREWNKFASQQSVLIYLQKGRLYYIEALHKEGDGGDHVAVGWRLPNDIVEAPIPGNRLVTLQQSLTQQANAITVQMDDDIKTGKMATFKPGVVVFPTPVNVSATVRLVPHARGVADLDLYDLNGKRIKKVFHSLVERGKAETVILPAEDLPVGTYILRYELAGKITTQKITVAR